MTLTIVSFILIVVTFRGPAFSVTDIDFCIFHLSVLVGKATPKNKATPHKPPSAAKKDRSVCEVNTHVSITCFCHFLASVWSLVFPHSISDPDCETCFSSTVPVVSSDDDDNFETCK